MGLMSEKWKELEVAISTPGLWISKCKCGFHGPDRLQRDSRSITVMLPLAEVLPHRSILGGTWDSDV